MAIKEGQTATNPKTGQKVVYRAGSWQPQTGPQPVSLAPQEQAEMSALRDQALKARSTDEQAQEFMRLNKGVATGPGHGGGIFNPVNWFNNVDTQNMEAITAGLAPAQRIPGSGSSSDKDVEMFKKALPSIDKYGDTNAALAKNLGRKRAENEARVAFYDQWVQQHGTLNGASGAFAASYGNAPQAQNKVQAAMGQKKPAAKAPAKKAAALYSKYGLEQ